jgi:hypothetical protein
MRLLFSFVLVLFCFSAVCQDVLVDTSTTAIIPFDKSWRYPFSSDCNPGTLTKNDLRILDSLIVVSVSDYNRSLKPEFKHMKIELSQLHYRKQLVVVTNQKGEKLVWVNFFCSSSFEKLWKENILIVKDGGQYFFNLKINLTKIRYYDFSVNGFA